MFMSLTTFALERKYQVRMPEYSLELETSFVTVTSLRLSGSACVRGFNFHFYLF